MVGSAILGIMIMTASILSSLPLHDGEGSVGNPSIIIDLIVSEHHHPDAEYARIRVVDGDTVRLLDRQESLRLVGYDAYELREPLGNDAKAYLQSICDEGHAYMLIDALEPRDRFGRLLGYLWCSMEVDGYTAWVSVQRAFLASDLIKSQLYIKPDLYPYWVWSEGKEIRFEGGAKGIDIGKVTLVGSDGIKVYENTNSIYVHAGVYRVCIASNDSCMIVNTLDEDDGKVYMIDVANMVMDGMVDDTNVIHVRSVEGSRMTFIHAEMPSMYIRTIRIAADDGFMARIKAVTDDGRIITSTLRDGRDQVHVDAKALLIKVYMVKKDSREVCIEGLGGIVMLNNMSVDRPCIRFTR